jgi:hypothetical protein
VSAPFAATAGNASEETSSISVSSGNPEELPTAEDGQRYSSAKPIPHIPLPFKELIADVLNVKPPEKLKKKK